MEEINKDYLMHHGILGMKWGIRRYQNKDGTLTPAGQKRAAKLESEYNKLTNNGKNKTSSSSGKKRTAKDLSDEELYTVINRLSLEKRYSDLMKEMSPKAESKAKQFISDVLGTSAKNIATQATTYMLGSLTNKAFEKAGFGTDVINPKKGQKDK